MASAMLAGDHNTLLRFTALLDKIENEIRDMKECVTKIEEIHAAHKND